nr:hypothetical protein I302_03386 [Kwoniella bestiolae CBS 10118]OCF25713.1 hypothetical protein I302_03386 [Kwoniella bestiolae CBS 10118]
MQVNIGHGSLHHPLPLPLPPHQLTSRNASTSSNRSNTHHAEYSESESEGEDDKVEKDKLEIRREKNRVKQRNLRLRRANHIAELERNLTNVRAEHSSLQNSFAHLQQRENNLQGWVHDLESTLFRNGLASEVETLRRIWADRDINKSSSLPPPPHSATSQHGSIPHQHPPPLPTPSGPLPADPLSTLARAASSVPPGSSYSEGRLSYPPPSSAGESRPTLPRPTSFSRPFENPYPTPELHWGSQMNEWVQAPPSASASDSDKKRKRDPYAADYPPPPPSSLRPGLHPMSGRLSESNIHTLPPIQSYRQTSPSSARPTSAPYQSERHSVPISASTSSGTGNVSPRSIRISDLVSLKPSHVDTTLPSLSTSLTASEITHPSMSLTESKRQLEMLTNREGGWSRRPSSKGDLSVTGEGSITTSLSEWNETPPFEILQTQDRGGLPNDSRESSFQPSFNWGQPFQPTEGKGDIAENQSILVPLCDWGETTVTPAEGQGTSTVGWSDSQVGLDQQEDGEAEGSLTDSIPHASVYTARILLLSILPQPILLNYTPVLPDLFKEQQQIVLTALSSLSPPEVAEEFRSRQLKGLSNEDAKLLLEYQSSSQADLRLVLFPIAILRAATIRVHKVNPGTFNLPRFISSTLREARIFGNPLDPDAWEMPDSFWDQWGHWFPPGRAYCASLSAWRRRDGHTGSTVIEMILGLKGEKDKRRIDWVGKPPGWKMPKMD